MKSYTLTIRLIVLIYGTPWGIDGKQAVPEAGLSKDGAVGQGAPALGSPEQGLALLPKEGAEQGPVRGPRQGPQLDLFTRMIQQAIRVQKLDPWQMPDKEFHINKRVMLMSFKSYIKLFNGVLTGLSNIVRTGPCYIQADEKGVRLMLDLGISNVHLHYKGTMTFRGQLHKIAIHARVKMARAILKIGQKSPTQVHVEKFKMDKLQGFKVNIREVGPPTSTMFTTLLKTVRMYIERHVKRRLEPTITQELNKRLQQGEQYLAGAKA